MWPTSLNGFSIFIFFTTSLFPSLTLGAPPPAPGGRCPVTRVDAFETAAPPAGDDPSRSANDIQSICGARGHVQSPSYLGRPIVAASVTECATQCLNRSKCKSFRFGLSKQPCQLYFRYLNQMKAVYNVTNPSGLPLFNRECFSRDCNTIAACQATTMGDCRNVSNTVRLGFIEYEYDTYSYLQYACGYGVNPRPINTPETNYEALQDSQSLSACEAIDQCNDLSDAHFTFHAQWNIKKQQWICITYGHPYGSFNYTFDPYYNSTYYETQFSGIQHRRFTYPNSTVGATYGFSVDAFHSRLPAVCC